MVHCGYDPSGALGTNYQAGDNWKAFCEFAVFKAEEIVSPDAVQFLPEDHGTPPERAIAKSPAPTHASNACKRAQILAKISAAAQAHSTPNSEALK